MANNLQGQQPRFSKQHQFQCRKVCQSEMNWNQRFLETWTNENVFQTTQQSMTSALTEGLLMLVRGTREALQSDKMWQLVTSCAKKVMSNVEMFPVPTGNLWIECTRLPANNSHYGQYKYRWWKTSTVICVKRAQVWAQKWWPRSGKLCRVRQRNRLIFLHKSWLW